MKNENKIKKLKKYYGNLIQKGSLFVARGHFLQSEFRFL